jgi:multiple sugar transport system permease protein
LSATTSGAPRGPTTTGVLLAARPRGRTYVRRYWMFAVPAALVVAVVIVFPWLFTLVMSVNDWKVSGNVYFVGLANYCTTSASCGQSCARCISPPPRWCCRW